MQRVTEMVDYLPIMQAAAPQSVVERISPNDLLPIAVVSIVFLAGTIIALVGIAFGSWRRVRERHLSATLIQDMLDRNMSASEIALLMNAWSAASTGRPDARPPEMPLPAVPLESSRRPPKPVAP